MKKILVLALSVLLLSSCATNDANNNESKNENSKQEAANYYDYLGTYEGILPCADCKGIKTKLVLSSGNKYSLKQEYIKAKNKLELLQDVQGEFVVGNGSLISLDKNASDARLFVNGEYAEFRDKDTGDKVSENNNYKLNRVN